MNNGYRCVSLQDSVQPDYQVSIQANSRQGNTVRNFYFAYVDAALSITGKEGLDYNREFINIKGGSTDYAGANFKAYGALATMITDSVLKFLDKKPEIKERMKVVAEKP
ncbi:MAG: hypothetical protein WC886_09020, partial [Saccharofermentanaceae bacterium]